MTRLYDKKSRQYTNYGAKGVKMSNDWLCFEKFLLDLPDLPGYEKWKLDPDHYDLDKDSLQIDKPINERIYSKETCQFITKSENRIYNNQGHGYYSKYNGVSYDKRRNLYTAAIKVNKKTINLGRFTNEEAAASVFDNYAKNIDARLINNVSMPYELAIKFKDKNFKPHICKHI